MSYAGLALGRCEYKESPPSRRGLSEVVRVNLYPSLSLPHNRQMHRPSPR